MKALTIGIFAVIFCNLIYTAYLAHAANLRAEHYKLLFEDASSIVDSQSHTIDSAQQSIAIASGVLETCIQIVRNK